MFDVDLLLVLRVLCTRVIKVGAAPLCFVNAHA